MASDDQTNAVAAATTTNASTVSEGKKHALAALDRRFAAAREVGLRREDHSRRSKRVRPSSEGEGDPEDRRGEEVGLSVSSPAPKPNPPLASASKKGHAVSSGGFSDGDTHPVYSELSEPVHENLLQIGAKGTIRRDAVSRIVNDIIQKGDEGAKYARGTKTLKFDSYILLDNFVQKDSWLKDARAKALRSHSKRSRKHMSMKQHKKCGSFDLAGDFHNFDLFKPMHEMWKEYIVELLKKIGTKKMAECLLMADLHGAFILVVECKTTALKGMSGIMIRETAETLGIITQDNRFRVVPKVGSVFIFQADCWKITVYGDKLSKRESLKQSGAQQDRNAS